MTENEDIDGLAAEYVVGTLGAAERAAVAARLAREPALAAAVAAWERRLGPLADAVPAIEPPPAAWQAIERRISGAGASFGGSAEVVVLEQRVKRWRRVAMTASALAAALLLVISVREFAYPKRDDTFVAVFQKDDASPSFLMSVDLVNRRITIRQVAAPVEPGKTYQLWIKADPIGPAPRSLGLIEARQITRELPYDPALLRQATFGISLEEAGGSRSGRPADNALHAKLIEATP